MNRFFLTMVFLLPLIDSVAAQTVYRCVNADGERVYADRACQHFGMSSATQKPAESGHSADPSLFSVEAEQGPAAASAGCPGASAEALRDSVLAAVSARDLNALTGMYHWAGAGRGSASDVIVRMQQLIAAAPQAAELRQPEPSDDWLWAGLPPPTELPPPELVLLATPDARNPVARFQLRAQAGCLWLSLN